jgi:hypothetical protein
MLRCSRNTEIRKPVDPQVFLDFSCRIKGDENVKAKHHHGIDKNANGEEMEYKTFNCHAALSF